MITVGQPCLVAIGTCHPAQRPLGARVKGWSAHQPARDHLQAGGGCHVIQVEEMHDEGVNLKTLQTVLTMLQSPIHAHLEANPVPPQSDRRSHCMHAWA